MRIDLHNHSTCSDGRLTPAALAERALAKGATNLALTDHDTVDGIAEAAAAGERIGLQVVAGVELSVEWRGRELHLLGLFVDPRAPSLVELLARAKEERARRLERMIERLNAQGIAVRLADVLLEARGATLTRPHLARALVALGHAESIGRAFDRFLSPGTPGFVPRSFPPLAEAIASVRAAGGVTSLAHPGVNRVSRHELSPLAEAGLDAVEAHHPDHPPNQAEAYARWARPLGLAVTGGSDFHGDGEGSSVAPLARETSAAEFERLEEIAKERGSA